MDLLYILIIISIIILFVCLFITIWYITKDENPENFIDNGYVTINKTILSSVDILNDEYCTSKELLDSYSLCCAKTNLLGNNNVQQVCGFHNLIGNIEFIEWLNPYVQQFNLESNQNKSKCECFFGSCYNYIIQNKCIKYQNPINASLNEQKTTKSWMTDNWDKFKFDNKWLSNVIFPGTHDSLSYGASSYISSAQSQPIETQIYDGIRYFDLRFQYIKNSKLGEDYQGYHGLSPFPVYLLNNNPISVPIMSNEKDSNEKDSNDTQINQGLSVKNSFVKYNSNIGIDKEVFILEWRLDNSDNIPKEKVVQFWTEVKNIFNVNNIFTQNDLASIMDITENVRGCIPNLPMITGKMLAMCPMKKIVEKSHKGPMFINYAHNYNSIPCGLKKYFIPYNDSSTGTIFNSYPSFAGINNGPQQMLDRYTSIEYTGKISENNPKVNILAITQSSGNIVDSLFNTATKITSVMSDFLLYKGPNSDPDNVPATPQSKNVFGPANNYGNKLYNYNIVTTNYYDLAPFVENMININELNTTYQI